MTLKNIICVLVLSVSIHHASGQDFLTGGYYCYDSLGVRQSVQFPEGRVYQLVTDEITRFRRRNHVTFTVEGYTLGDTHYTCNASFSGKIKNETPILKLGNNRGVQFALGRVVVGGEKKYVYILSMWEYKPAESCWTPLALYNTMNLAYSTEMNLSGHSIGFEGTPEFMRIDKGHISIR